MIRVTAVSLSSIRTSGLWSREGRVAA
jgi:hypothetical protein